MARLKGKYQIKRGEIWVVDLRPGVGWEVAKKRPALVISNNQINSIAPLIVVIPLSSNVPKIIGPERILFLNKEGGLEKDSVILVNQIRAVDKTRLVRKVGNISEEKLEEVEESLKLVLGLTPLD